MLIIKDGVISLTRGDTAYLEITITQEDGGTYALQEGDRLTLTVRERAEPGSDILLQSTSDTNTITLTAEQTAALPVGQQSFDVQLDTAGGEVFTVIGATSTMTGLKNFVVLPEVT